VVAPVATADADDNEQHIVELVRQVKMTFVRWRRNAWTFQRTILQKPVTVENVTEEES
jgi:hypothetical protein